MIEHEITLTREELQHEWDLSSKLCERLTEAVRTLAHERDEARKQRDELLVACRIGLSVAEAAVHDVNYTSGDAISRMIDAISSVEKSSQNP